MNLSNMVKNLAGDSGANLGANLKSVKNSIPGGLAGGALAGGLMATLLSNKSMRKTATKAAKYGGVALLGGLAYKAYQNWQTADNTPSNAAAGAQNNYGAASAHHIPNFETQALQHENGDGVPDRFQLALAKAMIAAARADGNIDREEQQRISEGLNNLSLDQASRSKLLELFIQPISIDDFIGDLHNVEERAEAYLASCLVMKLEQQADYIYLGKLSEALALPPGLEHQLRAQAAEVRAGGTVA